MSKGNRSETTQVSGRSGGGGGGGAAPHKVSAKEAGEQHREAPILTANGTRAKQNDVNPCPKAEKALVGVQRKIEVGRAGLRWTRRERSMWDQLRPSATKQRRGSSA